MSDWFDEGSAAGAVDVLALWSPGACDALVAVIATGVLVSAGLSSDGGACSVTITRDGRWRREWFRDADMLQEWLLGYLKAAEGDHARAASSAPRNRQRSRKAG